MTETVSEAPKVLGQKPGKWVLVTEESILEYDMPARSGLDRHYLLRKLDEANRHSKLLHIWIED